MKVGKGPLLSYLFSFDILIIHKIIALNVTTFVNKHLTKGHLKKALIPQ